LGHTIRRAACTAPKQRHRDFRRARIADVGSSDQFSNATPIKSFRRQISRHFRAVRKLSNDSSKIGGSMLREFNLIRAPTLVTSHTSHPNRPRLELKNNSTPLETAVLPVERLSISAVIRVLDKSLVGPTAAVMAAPNLSIHEPASNRAPGNDDRPKMPNLCPCRLRAHRSFKILTVSNHLGSPATIGAR
jgi:hypothetical protein